MTISRPDPSKLAAYGVHERRVSEDRLSVLAEEIDLVGYAVLEDVLTPDQIADLRCRADRLLDDRRLKAGGMSALKEVGEDGQVRAPLVQDTAFLELASNPRLLAAIRILLGDYVQLGLQNIIIVESDTEHHQATWHRDLPYQHWTSSRPVQVSALVCLDRFAEETGGTFVLPGSHKVEAMPSDPAIRRLAQPITAPAGAAVIFNSLLFHRAGHNTSGALRRGVNHVYSAPFLKQQIDLPAAFGGRYADDPELAKLLGYTSRSPKSADDWGRKT